MKLTRRQLVAAAMLGGGVATMPGLAQPLIPTGESEPRLLAARMALARHAGRIVHRDVVGVVDFSLPSRAPRFFLIDLASGRSSSLLVAHGRGSDPSHCGWLERFSNVPGSAASSDGAYLTAQEYEGQHGRSRRLHGLDPSNSNAEARAIVIHGAWYAEARMIDDFGKLGRSEGCFAFGAADLAQVMERLGPGRLIVAGKFGPDVSPA